MKILKVVGLCLILGVIVGCSPNCCSDTCTQQTKNTNVTIEMTDEFVVMAYSGPPPGQVTEARYREIAEAGIDVIYPGNGTFDGPSNLKSLDLAQKVGIRAAPFDMRAGMMLYFPDGTVEDDAIPEMVRDYKDHPAMAAYSLRDEPNAEMFPALAASRARFQELDPVHEPIINLFPGYGSPAQFGVADFRGYVREFLERVQPAFLCYDHYPFREPQLGDTTDWYGDLKIVSEEARRADTPFWIIIQSEGIHDYLRVPSRAEIFWQANTSLAYGAQGIMWFTYWTPQPDQSLTDIEEGFTPPYLEHHYNAMIDIDGNRTEVYDYVREENAFLHEAGGALVGWNRINTTHFKDGEQVGQKFDLMANPKGKGFDLVVGTFGKAKLRRTLIVNDELIETARFSLSSDREWQAHKVMATLDATVSGGELNGPWTLGPGGAVLIEYMRAD